MEGQSLRAAGIKLSFIFISGQKVNAKCGDYLIICHFFRKCRKPLFVTVKNETDFSLSLICSGTLGNNQTQCAFI